MSMFILTRTHGHRRGVRGFQPLLLLHRGRLLLFHPVLGFGGIVGVLPGQRDVREENCLTTSPTS